MAIAADCAQLPDGIRVAYSRHRLCTRNNPLPPRSFHPAARLDRISCPTTETSSTRKADWICTRRKGSSSRPFLPRAEPSREFSWPRLRFAEAKNLGNWRVTNKPRNVSRNMNETRNRIRYFTELNYFNRESPDRSIDRDLSRRIDLIRIRGKVPRKVQWHKSFSERIRLGSVWRARCCNLSLWIRFPAARLSVHIRLLLLRSRIGVSRFTRPFAMIEIRVTISVCARISRIRTNIDGLTIRFINLLFLIGQEDCLSSSWRVL